MNWYIGCFKKYADFSGRARRTEYWMFILFNMIASFVIGFVDGFAGIGGILSLAYFLVILIPSLSVLIRRLHDTGRSDWWCLISIIPVIGWIAVFVFLVLDSEPGMNQYGKNPKGNSSNSNRTGPMNELIKLNELKEKGIITEEEFQGKKASLL